MAAKSAIPTRRCGAAAGAFEVPEIGVGCWSFGCKEGEYWGKREQGGRVESASESLQCQFCS